MFLISLPIIPEAEFWLFELEDDPEVDPELLKNHPVNELEPLWPELELDPDDFVELILMVGLLLDILSWFEATEYTEWSIFAGQLTIII